MKSSSKLFLRWATHIFSFNVKVLHRKGKIHLNADILSREKSILDNPSDIDDIETSFHSLKSINQIKFEKIKATSLCNIKGLSHVDNNFTYTFKNLKNYQMNKKPTGFYHK